MQTFEISPTLYAARTNLGRLWVFRSEDGTRESATEFISIEHGEIRDFVQRVQEMFPEIKEP
jgi:hypothetical protein